MAAPFDRRRLRSDTICASARDAACEHFAPRPVVAVHAGAGILSADVRERADDCRGSLLRALETARLMLEAGESGLLAAERAVEILEDFELFNAGYGSALCEDGTVEMSAALMRGSDRAAGAVAGVRRVRHPIAAALAVLESPQVLLIGSEADRHAVARGAEAWVNDQFVTERQRARLAARMHAGGGTVGAACLDVHGELAAATSTGGIGGQPAGRVGDSPLLGAGTWADSRVAVSCTGDGEAFIRCATAHQLAALIAGGKSLGAAALEALSEVAELGGRGGLIAVDARGEVTMPFTSETMLRGVWRSGERPVAWIGETEGRT